MNPLEKTALFYQGLRFRDLWLWLFFGWNWGGGDSLLFVLAHSVGVGLRVFLPVGSPRSTHRVVAESEQV